MNSGEFSLKFDLLGFQFNFVFVFELAFFFTGTLFHPRLQSAHLPSKLFLHGHSLLSFNLRLRTALLVHAVQLLSMFLDHPLLCGQIFAQLFLRLLEHETLVAQSVLEDAQFGLLFLEDLFVVLVFVVQFFAYLFMVFFVSLEVVAKRLVVGEGLFELKSGSALVFNLEVQLFDHIAASK
jgi:hypothetical protein